MTRRLRVGVIFGGRSGEHEVSLRSAATIIGALDPARYDIVPIAITKDGRWRSGIDSLRLLDEAQRQLLPMPEHGVDMPLTADPTRRALMPLAGGTPVGVDVVFPVLHGTYGEDGTVQGLFELADVPYVGCGVLASALGMDKVAMRNAFQAAGLPLVPWITAHGHESIDDISARIAATIGFPCFVKPANSGSSVGISKVDDRAALAAAVATAAAFDPKLVIERGIDARELECAVLGNETPEASVVGEVIPSREFYDYVDKYVSDGAQTVIPADIPSDVADDVRRLAVAAFRAIDGAGLARVDFFLERTTGKVFLNEINTMPGFTAISMYPKLWEASGVPLGQLVDRLLALATARHALRSRRTLSFTPPTDGAATTLRRSGGGR